MKRLRGCLGVFLIFFFGVIVGIALTNGAIWKQMHDLIEGGPDAVVARVADRLDKELKLDDAQKRMLAEIVTETRIRLRVARADAQPQVEEALADARKRTRAILTSSQQRKFDEIVKRAGDNWLEPARVPTPPGGEKIESAPSNDSHPERSEGGQVGETKSRNPAP